MAHLRSCQQMGDDLFSEPRTTVITCARSAQGDHESYLVIPGWNKESNEWSGINLPGDTWTCPVFTMGVANAPRRGNEAIEVLDASKDNDG